MKPKDGDRGEPFPDDPGEWDDEVADGDGGTDEDTDSSPGSPGTLPDVFTREGLTDAPLKIDLTLDPEKAWLKMARSGLARPEEFSWCLAEAAVLNGATRLTIAFRNFRLFRQPFELSLTFDDAGFDLEELQRLHRYLTVQFPADPAIAALHALALGISGAMGCGAVECDLQSGHGTDGGGIRILAAGTTAPIPPAAVRGTRITARFPFAAPPSGGQATTVNERRIIERMLTPVLRSLDPRLTFAPVFGKQTVVPFPLPLSDDSFRSLVPAPPLSTATIAGEGLTMIAGIFPAQKENFLFPFRHGIRLGAPVPLKYRLRLPWRIGTIVLADAPDLATDLSRHVVSPETEQFRRILLLARSAQGKALARLLPGLHPARLGPVDELLFTLIARYPGRIRRAMESHDVKTCSVCTPSNSSRVESITSFTERLIHTPLIPIMLNISFAQRLQLFLFLLAPILPFLVTPTTQVWKSRLVPWKRASLLDLHVQMRDPIPPIGLLPGLDSWYRLCIGTSSSGRAQILFLTEAIRKAAIALLPDLEVRYDSILIG